MGCKHACTCGGFCPGCRSYEPESYFGEAEDQLARQRGYNSYQDEMEEAAQEYYNNNER